MSRLKESSTCPDGYRALSTSELRELLQNDEKMDQIIRLNETVGSPAQSPQSAQRNLCLINALLRLLKQFR